MALKERTGDRAIKKAYLIPKFHSSQHVKHIANRLLEIRDTERTFVIAEELPNVRSVREFLSQIGVKSDEEIAAFCQTIFKTLGSGMKLYKVYQELSSQGISIYPIGVGDRHDESQQYIKILYKSRELFENTRRSVDKFGDILYYSGKSLSLLLKASDIREPIILEQIRELIETNELPVSVVIDRARIPFLETGLSDINPIVKDYGPPNSALLIGSQLRQKAEQAVRREDYNLDLARYVVFREVFNVGGFPKKQYRDRDPNDYLEKILHVSSVKDAERLFNDLRRIKRQ